MGSTDACERIKHIGRRDSALFAAKGNPTEPHKNVVHQHRLAELPQGENLEYHVIVDNYCIHKRCDEWLAAHPNVTFHFTPTSASWLNMVEIWFNIMTRKILRGASFDSKDALADALMNYIKLYNLSAEPFIWRKREVRGSQIKDTIINLYG